MSFSTLLTGLALMSTTGWAQYTLQDDFMANGNFFDQFQFYNDTDPTEGFVDYVQRDYAQSAGLIRHDYGKIQMGVDSTNVASKRGREAVRIESTKTYDSGLIIVDIEHMPGGICGTWPAFWMFGEPWPSNGEIDILEGVNDQSTNDMTLHTGPGCSISRQTDMQANVYTDNCDVDAEGQSPNTGCQIQTQDTRTYGKGFNDNGGGVYATEIMSSFINIFFFPRGSIPSDISSATPDPSSWGKPMAVFKGDCDISKTFQDLKIVFTNTFCGSWAGNAWSDGQCASKADTCVDYVQNNPSAFQDAYWSVNSLKVYQQGAAPYTSSKTTSSESTSYSVSATSETPTPYSSIEPSSSSRTRTKTRSWPVYSTKGIDIPIPSDAPMPAWSSGNPINRVAPTTAAETPAGESQAPSRSDAVAASATSAAVEAEISAEARHRPEGWQYRGSSRHSRKHERTARHLRQHKRHGNGRL